MASSTVPTTLSGISTNSAAITMTAPQSTASTLASVSSFSPAFDTLTTSATTVIPSTDSTASTASPASTALTTITVSTASTTSTSSRTTTAKLVTEVLTDLEFRSTDTFIDALKDSKSAEHKNRAKLVRDELEAVYRPKYANFLKVIVLGFREFNLPLESSGNRRSQSTEQDSSINFSQWFSYNCGSCSSLSKNIN
ncbi:cell wall protein DAN4-like isoform X2 [Cyprinus carpio]|uniref:Cell wall protein DAN4-like isoform X2 n=1 Tax=Cyprinus carpio TaxID=7962 RepID=A0A9R0B291_CYPCA|nr:cell wall protein DAN4-like isoform X2 [Cyprinus carpio]